MKKHSKPSKDPKPKPAAKPVDEEREQKILELRSRKGLELARMIERLADLTTAHQAEAKQNSQAREQLREDIRKLSGAVRSGAFQGELDFAPNKPQAAQALATVAKELDHGHTPPPVDPKRDVCALPACEDCKGTGEKVIHFDACTDTECGPEAKICGGRKVPCHRHGIVLDEALPADDSPRSAPLIDGRKQGVTRTPGAQKAHDEAKRRGAHA